MSEYYDGLWKEVWERKLSDKEVASVVAELQEPKPDTNIYTLLAILCYCESQAIQYTPLIERYLNGPDDFVASEALWVLCSCWDLSPNYTNELLAFMESAPQYEDYEDRKRVGFSDFRNSILTGSQHLR
jgi:hypothetical protein